MVCSTSPYKLMSWGGISSKISFSFGFQIPNSSFFTSGIFLLATVKMSYVCVLHIEDIGPYWLSKHVQNSSKAKPELLEGGWGLEKGGVELGGAPSLKIKPFGVLLREITTPLHHGKHMMNKYAGKSRTFLVTIQWEMRGRLFSLLYITPEASNCILVCHECIRPHHRTEQWEVYSQSLFLH